MKFYQSMCVGVLVTVAGMHSTQALSLEQFKRGFKSCSDNCSTSKIKCEGKASDVGSYEWCKKNCVYEGKTDQKTTTDGLEKCEKTSSSTVNDNDLAYKMQGNKSLTPMEKKRVADILKKKDNGGKLNANESNIESLARALKMDK